MPDPTYIVQCRLPRDTGLAVDDVVNTWHFQGDSVVDQSDDATWALSVEGLVERIETFYVAIGGFFASTLTGFMHTNVYNFYDAKPRAPKVLSTVECGKGSNTLPNEVALCLSFRATLDSGTNPARRRGRVYLGPFATNSMFGGGSEGAGDARPADAMTDAILTAAEDMARGVSGSARLAIYSPTTDIAGTPEEAMNDAVFLWIDNAWDTQRRRGAAATARTSRVLTG